MDKDIIYKYCTNCKQNKEICEFKSIGFKKEVKQCIECRKYISSLRKEREITMREKKARERQQNEKDCTLQII